jgi:ABC transporter substrate binding protein
MKGLSVRFERAEFTRCHGLFGLAITSAIWSDSIGPYLLSASICGTSRIRSRSISSFSARAASRTIPNVFAVVAYPVAAGLVESLPNPGGNITGFISQQTAMAGKWLELLTEIAPAVKRAGIMFNPDTAPSRVNSSRR